jgi:outer membrane protein
MGMKVSMSARQWAAPALMRTSWLVLMMICGLLCYGPRSWAADIRSAYTDVLPGDTDTIACPTTFDRTSPLSLAGAIDLALCNNAQIRVAWAVIREQAAAVGEAKAAYWPTMSVELSELKDNTGYPGSPLPAADQTEHTVYASFDWRLFDFGGRAASRRAAEATLEAAVASRDALVQKTLGAVIQAYFGGITAQAMVDDKTDEEAVARETWVSAQRREAQGRGAQSDTLQAATALAKVSLDKNRAMGTYDNAEANLVYLTGLPVGGTLRLPGEIDQLTGAEEQDLRAWLDDAERHHPAILAARAALDAANSQVVAIRSSGRPTLDLMANYYQNGYPNQGLTSTNTNVGTIGITVTVPLFDGFLTHYKIDQARAVVKEKEADLEDTEQSTLMGVINAHAAAVSSLRNLGASEDLLRAAQAAFDSSQRRYESGAAEITELLATQTARADAKAERVRCLAEWRAARLTLLASAGKINRASVHE